MAANEEEPVDSPGETTDAATEHYNAAIVARARAVLYASARADWPLSNL